MTAQTTSIMMSRSSTVRYQYVVVDAVFDSCLGVLYHIHNFKYGFAGDYWYPNTGNTTSASLENVTITRFITDCINMIVYYYVLYCVFCLYTLFINY